MSARSEIAPRIVALRAEGLLYREIAERLGLAPSTVHDYATDPDGTRVRARKAKADGACRDCGVRTISDGGRAPERCMPCHGAHTREQSRRWILNSFKEWTDLFGVPPSATDWSPASARAQGMAHRAERTEQTGRAWPPTSSVINIFGSWNAGRQAAGFDTFEAGQCGRDGDDPRVCEETVRLYRAGLSCAAVGELMGVSAQAVCHRLIVAGEPRRDLGRPKATEREAA
jgi:predicted transcriptional regulator